MAWLTLTAYSAPPDLETFVETIEGRRRIGGDGFGRRTRLSRLHLGRMAARMLGAAARYESEHKGERTWRKHLESRRGGQAQAVGDRPFGFEADRLTHRPDEVALIRAAVIICSRVDRCARSYIDWRDRGITTPGGNVVEDPPRAGCRPRRGSQGCGRTEAWSSPTVWEPIITRTQHDPVALAADKRRPASPRAYLLTGGLARCGRCGAAMIARPNSRWGRRYACTKDRRCNGTFKVLAEPLETFVHEAVVAALDGPALMKARGEVSTTPPKDDLSKERRRWRPADAKRSSPTEAVR